VANRDIIVVGASAGGVDALQRLASGLPEGLGLTVFVVLHQPATGSRMATILRRGSNLPVIEPEDGEAITAERMYLARPDYHLLVHEGYIRLSHGPRENRVRPAVDPLFRTAALAYGPRVVGVILTGSLDDGAAGLLAVRQRGGTAIVQDPEDAAFASMPRCAIEDAGADAILPLAEIPAYLAELARTPAAAPSAGPVPARLLIEASFAEAGVPAGNRPEEVGSPSPLSCPDCGGVLWTYQDDAPPSRSPVPPPSSSRPVRFRCRTGHAYSPASLAEAQRGSIEGSLFAARRALEENAIILDRMAKRAIEVGNVKSHRRFERRAHEARRHAEQVRMLLLESGADGENLRDQGKTPDVNPS
jgi:two-component system, chemotaxis family, protein-glutamate methylesterase/glutaminase